VHFDLIESVAGADLLANLTIIQPGARGHGRTVQALVSTQQASFDEVCS